MDDLTPEDDLKPDTSDRRSTRSRKPSSNAPKLAVSRQHLMIGIGILVLLLLIMGIGSALKAPVKQETARQTTGPKDINLSGSIDDATNVPAPSAAAQANTAQINNGQQPQNIDMPSISETPTQAQPLAGNEQAKERVDLPGNMNEILSQQQDQVNTAAQGSLSVNTQSLTSLPTAPATVSRSVKTPVTVTNGKAATTPSKVATTSKAVTQSKPTQTVRNPLNATTPTQTKTATAPVSASGSMSALKTAPGTNFTLQLSGASQSSTLNAYARQQGLKDYMVYQAGSRDGKPWFVLVSGNYASSADAKRAIASLPADVQAKKPWVKPVHQVQQDLKK